MESSPRSKVPQKELTSNLVESNQLALHPNLEKIVKNYCFNSYQRPIAEHTAVKLKPILPTIQDRPLILDLGCGQGESTKNLAHENPNCFVLGVDKSLNRTTKGEKAHRGSNFKIIRGDLIDTILILAKTKTVVRSIYLLYPNPWPKKKHIQRRVYGHPIFKYILDFNCYLEMRTNWSLFAEEFTLATKLYGRKDVEMSKFYPGKPISAFERKYLNSKHQLYKVVILEN